MIHFGRIALWIAHVLAAALAVDIFDNPTAKWALGVALVRIFAPCHLLALLLQLMILSLLILAVYPIPDQMALCGFIVASCGLAIATMGNLLVSIPDIEDEFARFSKWTNPDLVIARTKEIVVDGKRCRRVDYVYCDEPLIDFISVDGDPFNVIMARIQEGRLPSHRIDRALAISATSEDGDYSDVTDDFHRYLRAFGAHDKFVANLATSEILFDDEVTGKEFTIGVCHNPVTVKDVIRFFRPGQEI